MSFDLPPLSRDAPRKSRRHALRSFFRSHSTHIGDNTTKNATDQSGRDFLAMESEAKCACAECMFAEATGLFDPKCNHTTTANTNANITNTTAGNTSAVHQNHSANTYNSKLDRAICKRLEKLFGPPRRPEYNHHHHQQGQGQGSGEDAIARLTPMQRAHIALLGRDARMRKDALAREMSALSADICDLARELDRLQRLRNELRYRRPLSEADEETLAVMEAEAEQWEKRLNTLRRSKALVKESLRESEEVIAFAVLVVKKQGRSW